MTCRPRLPKPSTQAMACLRTLRALGGVARPCEIFHALDRADRRRGLKQGSICGSLASLVSGYPHLIERDDKLLHLRLTPLGMDLIAPLPGVATPTTAPPSEVPTPRERITAEVVETRRPWLGPGAYPLSPARAAPKRLESVKGHTVRAVPVAKWGQAGYDLEIDGERRGDWWPSTEACQRAARRLLGLRALDHAGEEEAD